MASTAGGTAAVDGAGASRVGVAPSGPAANETPAWLVIESKTTTLRRGEPRPDRMLTT